MAQDGINTIILVIEMTLKFRNQNIPPGISLLIFNLDIN